MVLLQISCMMPSNNDHFTEQRTVCHGDDLPFRRRSEPKKFTKKLFFQKKKTVSTQSSYGLPAARKAFFVMLNFIACKSLFCIYIYIGEGKNL